MTLETVLLWCRNQTLILKCCQAQQAQQAGPLLQANKILLRIRVLLRISGLFIVCICAIVRQRSQD